MCILDLRNGWEFNSRSISLLIIIAGSSCYVAIISTRYKSENAWLKSYCTFLRRAFEIVVIQKMIIELQLT